MTDSLLDHGHDVAPVEIVTPHIYVVAIGQMGGNVWGFSCDADRIWFQHISSSLWWLMRDCTTHFSNRRYELEQAYPDGFEVVLIEPEDEMPEEIRHHLSQACPTPDGSLCGKCPDCKANATYDRGTPDGF